MITTPVVAVLGLLLGIVFGVLASRANFCTMGGVADIVNMGSWTRMRMWMAALGVAVLVTGALQLSGSVDVGPSLYTAPRLRWLSHLVGGLLFGIGMVLAGGCANKQLLRIGAGNMRALVVSMVLAIAAATTLTGLFALWRVRWLDAVALDLPVPQQLPHLLAHASGMPIATAWLIGIALFGLLPLAWALASPQFRQRDTLLAGLGIGLVVAAGWYVTGHVAFVAEHPETLEPAWIGTAGNRPESLTFVAPHAQAMTLLTRWSDASAFVSFGVASLIGVILGAFGRTLAARRWKVEVFRDGTDFFRHVGGGVLMGFGGVTALGCTVGQGMTGMSTLSIGSLLTTLAIIAGAALMVKIDFLRA